MGPIALRSHLNITMTFGLHTNVHLSVIWSECRYVFMKGSEVCYSILKWQARRALIIEAANRSRCDSERTTENHSSGVDSESMNRRTLNRALHTSMEEWQQENDQRLFFVAKNKCSRHIKHMVEVDLPPKWYFMQTNLHNPGRNCKRGQDHSGMV